MAKVLKFFYFFFFIWIGIADCVPIGKTKIEPDINGNTVTVSVSFREYSRLQPYKISNDFPLNNFQEQYYKTISDLFRQMEEYLNSIRIRTQNINLPFNYFSTNPIFTILSKPNTNYPSIPDSLQQNHNLGIQTTNITFHTNRYNNSVLIPDNTPNHQIPNIVTSNRSFNTNLNNNFQSYSRPQNQIPNTVTTNRLFNTNLNNNFQSYSRPQNEIPNTVTTNRLFNTNLNNNYQSYRPPQNQITNILITKRPLITTKRTEVITTGTPIENTTPYIEEISTTKLEETTTVENLEDDDDTTRPITLYDTKADKFNSRLLRSGTRIQPEVEHGSVQSGY